MDQELLDEFRKLGVNEFVPGFYDDPAFLRAEKMNPRILDRYALFIERSEFPPDYLERSALLIPKTVEFMYAKLVSNGEVGVCLDASMVLSRMLESIGIWNYMVQGCMAIAQQKKNSFTRFTPFRDVRVDEKTALITSHTWLVAPPFRIIDITASRQALETDVQPTNPICTTTANIAKPVLRELVNDLCAAQWKTQYGSDITLARLKVAASRFFKNMDKFGVWTVYSDTVKLKYYSCHITAPIEPLREFRNLELDGLMPFELVELFQDTLQNQLGPEFYCKN